ncbi:MAG: GNAT family N-acetyltransferase [Treponema sp.]|nr:GNAT family N-acetyltransferase [Treponema sp.]MCL2251124.1 GNAT family N-acetyltransferase [Treponema sp.]
MEIKIYLNDYFNAVFNLVHKTIEEIYPGYYPRAAVDFFHNHHSKENMEKQLPNEYTLILMEDDKIIATGTLAQNEIKRFFVLPEYQGKGYGKLLLKELEKKIDFEKYDKLILDSSLGAVKFYETNGYTYKQYMTIDLPDNIYLCYLEMEKIITK